MKTINIYGENKYEQSTKYREACRGIVLKEDKILLTQISLNEAVDIFSKHQDYADVDEMKRGAYLREYQALLSYLDR